MILNSPQDTNFLSYSYYSYSIKGVMAKRCTRAICVQYLRISFNSLNTKNNIGSCFCNQNQICCTVVRQNFDNAIWHFTRFYN